MWVSTRLLLEALLGGLAGLGAYAAGVATMQERIGPGQQRWLLLASAVAALLAFLTARAGGYRLRRSQDHDRSSHGPPPGPGEHRQLGMRMATFAGAVLAMLVAAGNAVLIAAWLGLPPPFASADPGSGVTTSEPVDLPTSEPGPSASTAPPDTGTAPPEDAGDVIATLTVTPDQPGGCSASYLVSGDVVTPRVPGHNLWAVSVLHADPANGLQHALHFAKYRIDVETGPYSVPIPANRAGGVRRAHWVLVTADQQAHADLQANYDADRVGDRSAFPDTRRITLPAGASVVARSDEHEQRC